jgi:hypothetical protein
MIPYRFRRFQGCVCYAHLTILPQPHTGASGSIFAHFQIEQSGSKMAHPHTGSSGPIFAQSRVESTGLPLLIRTMGHRDRSLLNSKLSNRIEDGSSAHWVIGTDLYPSAGRAIVNDSDPQRSEMGQAKREKHHTRLL